MERSRRWRTRRPSTSGDARGLLKAANIPGPYILAGHSVGGPYALAYAMDYPADVAGVALLDSSTPYQFDLPSYDTFYSVAHRVSGLLPPLARAGIVRAYITASGSSLPPGAKSQAETFASSPRTERRPRRVRRAANRP